jgi:hypothetical protein
LTYAYHFAIRTTYFISYASPHLQARGEYEKQQARVRVEAAEGEAARREGELREELGRRAKRYIYII